MLSQPGIPLGIFMTLVVLTTVSFNDYLVFQFDKIDDVGAQGMLPAKLCSSKPFPSQITPKAMFCIGHVFT